MQQSLGLRVYDKTSPKHAPTQLQMCVCVCVRARARVCALYYLRRPHADPVRRAQGPRLQIVLGAQGDAALLLPAPQGTPLAGANSRRCATAHTVQDGRRACPAPPWGGGGGGDDDEMASQRSRVDSVYYSA